jgi:ABC-type Fe3+ transport system permease subunit
MSWRKWTYVGAIVFTLVSMCVHDIVEMMPGEIGRWLRFASNIGVGLPSLLVGLDLIIAPEKAPLYSIRYQWWRRDIDWWRPKRPTSKDMRRLGFSLLVFSAVVFYATIRQWQFDLVHRP